ncbi:hypothetical protein ACQKP8_23570 [Photobacterium alginatilyticum]|uniref:hypothetical protein n=1 Tax=Photobacterium alginatilyticum TaxID=1775171 RepID=UPI004069359A
MKRLNHTLIAGALCAVVSPPHDGFRGERFLLTVTGNSSFAPFFYDRAEWKANRFRLI